MAGVGCAGVGEAGMAALEWGVQRPWGRRGEVNHRTWVTHIGELILGYLGLRGLRFTHPYALDPSCTQSLYLRDREALGGTYSPALSWKEPPVTRHCD